MVCFFKVAFDNGLRFPLHPFIKGDLARQHFNVCPSQLALNGWGILVGLLAFFRDRGLGVPSIALLLYLFSPKETAEGFLYFSRRAGAPLVISDLPSSHRSWKGRYFFVSGRSWEYDLLDKDDNLGVPVAWTTSENLRKCSLYFGMTCTRSSNIPDHVFPSCYSGARIDLSAEDEAVALALSECHARPYAELIKSGIHGPSSSKSARFGALRPSPPSTMRVSPVRPSAAHPTRGAVLAQLVTLSWKPRSVKRKTSNSAEKDRPVLAKAPKLGASPPFSVRKSERARSPVAEAPMVMSSPPPSKSAAKAKSPLGGAVEQPLAVMPITIWNSPSESARSPPRRAEELKRKNPESKVGEDEDFLLFNAELTAGAVSSILKDYDLRRSKALPVDEVLALSLQGVASVSPFIWLCLFPC